MLGTNKIIEKTAIAEEGIAMDNDRLDHMALFSASFINSIASNFAPTTPQNSSSLEELNG